MLAGHFAVAGIVKAWRPEIPMAALLVATRLPDLVFAPLTLTGFERMEPAEPGLSGGRAQTESDAGVIATWVPDAPEDGSSLTCMIVP